MEFLKRRKCQPSRVRQRDISDCGPACLSSICSSYGLYIAVSRVRQLAKTDRKGTSVLGIVEAAIQIGFDAKGVETDYESFELDIFPAIAHVITAGHLSHFVVVVKMTKGFVQIMDPAEGRYIKMTENEFRGLWTGVAILLVPNEKFSPNEKLSRLRRIMDVAAPYYHELTIGALCAVVVSGIGLILSFYLKEIIDDILPGKRLHALHMLSGLIVIMLVMQFVTGLLKNKLILKANRGINSSLILRYYRHVMHLPKQFFDSMRTGEIVSRVNDSVKISAFINEVVVNLAVDVLVILFSLLFMFVFNWQIALIVFSIAPAYLLLFCINNYINKRWQRRIMESAANLEAHLVESIGSVTTIRYLAVEDHFCKKAADKMEKLLGDAYKFSVKQLGVERSADFVTRLFTVALLWAGSYYVVIGNLSTGALVSFYSLLACFTVPLLNIMGAGRLYGDAKVAADRLFEIMDLKRMETGWKKLYLDPGKHVSVRFENVAFRYGNNDLVLKDINLKIEGGTITGITGKSGGGKSTLAALLLRCFEPEKGSIWINNANIAEVSRECLTDIVAIAHQHPDLFSGTIAENIVIGRQFDRERLEEISGRLGIVEFASLFPDKMNTHLSEQGNNLSGGQRQRIAIARALYRNCRVLILDEATTAIDTGSEEKIMQTIEWYKNQGNTVIIIAHNDSTLKICDNIAVLDDGRMK